MRKMLCCLLTLILVMCSIPVSGVFASAQEVYVSTESGYSYQVTIEDNKPSYWVISTPDATRATYEYSTIDSRDLGIWLSRYADAVDTLKNAEDAYKNQVNKAIIVLVPLTLVSSAVPAKWPLLKAMAALLPAFSISDVTDAMDLYDDVLRARQNCEEKFSLVTYTISR